MSEGAHPTSKAHSGICKFGIEESLQLIDRILRARMHQRRGFDTEAQKLLEGIVIEFSWVLDEAS
jgi:hypothetical protein